MINWPVSFWPVSFFMFFDFAGGIPQIDCPSFLRGENIFFDAVLHPVVSDVQLRFAASCCSLLFYQHKHSQFILFIYRTKITGGFFDCRTASIKIFIYKYVYTLKRFIYFTLFRVFELQKVRKAITNSRRDESLHLKQFPWLLQFIKFSSFAERKRP